MLDTVSILNKESVLGNLDETSFVANGTGPFKLVSHEHGSNITLEKNSYYFGDLSSYDNVMF